MKYILDQIHWYIERLKYEHKITACLQWVRSHEQTIGNEKADVLAKKGMRMVQRDKKFKYNRWSYFSVRAARNSVNEQVKNQMVRQLRTAIMDTEYGLLWQRYMLLHEEQKK